MNRIHGVQLEKYVKSRVGVIIDTAQFDNYSYELTTVSTVLILSKWCNDIEIVCKEPQVNFSINPYWSKALEDVLGNIVRSNNANARVSFSLEPSNGCSAYISIGSSEYPVKNKLCTLGMGWVYGFGDTLTLEKKKLNEPNNPIGPFAAACFSNAEVFKFLNALPSIFNSGEHINEAWFDFYSNSVIKAPFVFKSNRIPSKLNVGNVLQAGAGAVGSSLTYLLSFMDLSGHIDIVDYDSIDFPNVVTSLPFTEKHLSIDKQYKALVCASHNTSSLTIEPHIEDYNAFISKAISKRKEYDIILCLANERSIWPSIQDNLPPLVLDVTTTPNWGINFARHLPNEDWCLVCRFGVKDYVHKPVCGNTAISAVPKEEKLGALPFISALASIVLLSEWIKLAMGLKQGFNFLQGSLQGTKGYCDLGFLETPKSGCPSCSNLGGKSKDFQLKKFSKTIYCELIKSNLNEN